MLKQIGLAAALAAATIGYAQTAVVGELTGPRFRIVPQSTDGEMRDIEESADGTRLITHDRGYAPRLWDAKRQILLRVLTGHPDAIHTVFFSRDGSRIVTVSNHEARVWNSLRAKFVSSTRPPSGEEFTKAAISADGTTLFLGTSAGKVIASESANPLRATSLGSFAKTVYCLLVSPDGSSLLGGSVDGEATLWNLSNRSPIWQIKGPLKAVQWASFSGDGKLLALSSIEQRAVVVDSMTGNVLGSYDHAVAPRGGGNVGSGATFVGSGHQFLMTFSKNGELILTDVKAKKSVGKLTGHTDAIREIRFSTDGKFASTYADDNTLRMWDIEARAEMPFKPEDGMPMAASFSPTGPFFWLGYSEGEVRKYDLLTGRAARSTYGDVVSLGYGRLVGSNFWMRSARESGWGGGPEAKNLFLDAFGANAPLVLDQNLSNFTFAPNGRYVAYVSRTSEPGFRVIDVHRQIRFLEAPTLLFDVGWSADSSRIAVLSDGGQVGVYESGTGNRLHLWEWTLPPEGPKALSGVAFHPTEPWLVTTGHAEGTVALWDYVTGTGISALGKFEDQISEIEFSHDGSLLAILGWDTLVVFDVAGAKGIYSVPSVAGEHFNSCQFSADGKRLSIQSQMRTLVFEASTGKALFSAKEGAKSLAFSPDGKKVLTGESNSVKVWAVDEGKELMRLHLASDHRDLQFTADGSRILAADEVEGVTIWDAHPTPLSNDPTSGLRGASRRIATIVMMKTGGWLVYDEAGRYDCADPSNPSGAYFVIEWEGGLEAVTMSQLKSQFYDPGLLTKVLGLSKEPLRDVPSLDSLRLFPELKVDKNGASKLDIQAIERDEGGVGRVTVFVNGKQVLVSRKGAGYIQIDTADYQAFMLPETALPAGQGNQLALTVTNQRGDLVSAPVIVDIGVPKGLKVPDVKLFALCAGAGDYVGITGDLAAPASDAKAVAGAIGKVAERLLPGKTSVTVLSTDASDPGARPTRKRILEWFRDTATKASSSDIIFVFFAGHGVSKIGDTTGYYFLTSDADPSSLSTAADTATISGEDLKTALSSIAANKQVVVLDTCHSGAAASSLLEEGRSISGDYQRAWEGIRDTTGTWMLAGSAADQRSYESPNVEHGVLTYSLLEALDRASASGLRQAESGDLFVDVERWLTYAANRVESLKYEVGVTGIQKPEFKRSTRGASFDLGVVRSSEKGFIGLRPPKPVVIVGNFEMDQEDPLKVEELVQSAMRDSKEVKAWFDVTKHPNVYRIAGTYTVDGEAVKVRLFVQKFDQAMSRKTLETVELSGKATQLDELVAKVRTEVERRIAALSAAAPKQD